MSKRSTVPFTWAVFSEHSSSMRATVYMAKPNQVGQCRISLLVGEV
jgi:hypothetical protein